MIGKAFFFIWLFYLLWCRFTYYLLLIYNYIQNKFIFMFIYLSFFYKIIVWYKKNNNNEKIIKRIIFALFLLREVKFKKKWEKIYNYIWTIFSQPRFESDIFCLSGAGVFTKSTIKACDNIYRDNNWYIYWETSF